MKDELMAEILVYSRVAVMAVLMAMTWAVRKVVTSVDSKAVMTA
jgi:hypothetical protein